MGWQMDRRREIRREAATSMELATRSEDGRVIEWATCLNSGCTRSILSQYDQNFERVLKRPQRLLVVFWPSPSYTRRLPLTAFLDGNVNVSRNLF